MVNLNIEQIYNDLVGLHIVDDFVISSIDISKCNDYLILSVYVLNSKTNETCFLQHDISAISNIYITYSYLSKIFGVIAMRLICDDERDFSNNEHGLMYNIKTRELINY